MEKLRSKWDIFLDNIYMIMTGKFRNDDIDLNTICDRAFRSYGRRFIKPSIKSTAPLSSQQKKAIREFYAPYKKNITTDYHRYYTHFTGKFSPEYIVDDLYYTYIDRYFNGRQEARFLDNKCYYHQYFRNIKQADTLAIFCNGTWLNTSDELMTIDQVVDAVMSESEVVLKKAWNSECALGVYFVKTDCGKAAIKEKLMALDQDYVIQKVIKQHQSYSKLHPTSVNTVRVISVLFPDGVKIYSRRIRIGVGDSRVDNSSMGGFMAGIDKDGYLSEKGYFKAGVYTDEHPELGLKLKDIQLPYIDKIDELVKAAHLCVPHFRMISWDIAVDEDGEAVLVETNLSLGGLANVQCVGGPLFGDDTKKILDEVFGVTNESK